MAAVEPFHGDGGHAQQPRLILGLRYLDDIFSVWDVLAYLDPLLLLQRVLPRPLAHPFHQYSHVAETWTDLFEDLVEFVEDNAIPDLVDLE
jgi:hypothetical protein